MSFLSVGDDLLVPPLVQDPEVVPVTRREARQLGTSGTGHPEELLTDNRMQQGCAQRRDAVYSVFKGIGRTRLLKRLEGFLELSRVHAAYSPWHPHPLTSASAESLTS